MYIHTYGHTNWGKTMPFHHSSMGWDINMITKGHFSKALHFCFDAMQQQFCTASQLCCAEVVVYMFKHTKHYWQCLQTAG